RAPAGRNENHARRDRRPTEVGKAFAKLASQGAGASVDARAVSDCRQSEARGREMMGAVLSPQARREHATISAHAYPLTRESMPPSWNSSTNSARIDFSACDRARSLFHPRERFTENSWLSGQTLPIIPVMPVVPAALVRVRTAATPQTPRAIDPQHAK